MHLSPCIFTIILQLWENKEKTLLQVIFLLQSYRHNIKKFETNLSDPFGLIIFKCQITNNYMSSILNE